MGRRCSEMVQGDGDPDDRCQQLGEGQTSDCVPTRCRWQKSSSKSKVKQVNDDVTANNDEVMTLKDVF